MVVYQAFLEKVVPSSVVAVNPDGTEVMVPVMAFEPTVTSPEL